VNFLKIWTTIFFAKRVLFHLVSQSVGNPGHYFCHHICIHSTFTINEMPFYKLYTYINPKSARTLLVQLTSKCNKDINCSFVSFTLKEEHKLRWWLSSSGRWHRVDLIRTDVSEDRIASIFRVHECEQVTDRSCKLLYRHRLVGDNTRAYNFAL
jgi:hypothetical protein